jgi:hypothetical protein
MVNDITLHLSIFIDNLSWLCQIDTVIFIPLAKSSFLELEKCNFDEKYK